MNEIYDKISEVVKEAADDGFDLEEVIGALHIAKLHCETALRLKLVNALTDDKV